MLEARAFLPITELKGDMLRLLKDNDVLVVCGETGCGKTTQVPQFILDDMIEAGWGSYCNIVCTKPRRIVAISIAERVADERCKPSPGSDGSLVDHVHLDSTRWEDPEPMIQLPSSMNRCDNLINPISTLYPGIEGMNRFDNLWCCF